MSSATRWGIISAGEISNDFVVSFATLPPEEHQIVSVAARNYGKAQEFAKLHRISHVAKSYDEVFKDSNVEVVYIGSIHSEHLKLSKQALDHGKHVLCEKPLCMNVKETQELISYARAKKLFFMEAIWTRFFPAYYKLREELEKGTIGEVKQVIATFGEVFEPMNWRRDLSQGGGTVLDIGTYTSQFATLVFAGLKPIKIVASGQLNSSGCDESSSATVIYPNGKTATLLTSSEVRFPGEALAIGTKGTLKLKWPFWAPEELETPTETFKYPLPPVDKSKKLYFWNTAGLCYQCHEVRRCIQKGLTQSPLMTWDDTLQIAELRETIRKQIGVFYPQDK